MLLNKLLFLFDWCSQDGTLKVFKIIYKLVNLVRWAVPIILIVFCVIDVAKMVINPDKEKDIKKSVTTRLLAAVIVFLVPTLINLVMNIVSIGEGKDTGSHNYSLSDCWQKAKDGVSTKSSTQYENYKGTDNSGFGGANRTTGGGGTTAGGGAGRFK